MASGTLANSLRVEAIIRRRRALSSAAGRRRRSPQGKPTPGRRRSTEDPPRRACEERPRPMTLNDVSSGSACRGDGRHGGGETATVRHGRMLAKRPAPRRPRKCAAMRYYVVRGTKPSGVAFRKRFGGRTDATAYRDRMRERGGKAALHVRYAGFTGRPPARYFAQGTGPEYRPMIVSGGLPSLGKSRSPTDSASFRVPRRVRNVDDVVLKATLVSNATGVRIWIHVAYE